MKPLEVLFLSQQDVIDAGGTDMKAVIDDVMLSFSLFDQRDCVLPTKTSLRWGDAQSEVDKGRIAAMPGYIGGSVHMAGIKWIGGSPKNPFRHDIPRASGLLILNDPETMVPLAILDSAVISAMRTGAVTGVAARYLARPNSRIAGVIGAGVQGRTQLMALKASLPRLCDARVFDLDAARLATFCHEMSAELGMRVTPVASHRECVQDADVFVTAVVTNSPVVKNAWVSPGSFYAHIGSYECEFDVLRDSDKVVVDWWEGVIHRDVNSLAKAHAAGLFPRDRLYAELGELVNGKKPGRERPDERIMCVPIGFALHDLVVGTRIYRTAKARGLGTALSLYEQPVWA